MMESRPLITIGVTTYNAADTLRAAIDSALEQTWQPIEIVVVDDCSQDETHDILSKLADEHPAIRVFINAENCGVAVARNRILEEAKGEFVTFFDDDDRSEPQRLAKQLQRIVDYERDFSNGKPVICHSARNVVYPDGEEYVEPTMGQILGHRAPAGEAVARRVLMGEPLKDGYGACPTCSQMARLSTYKALGGFDPRLRRGEDTDFTIRLALEGGHFVGISEPLVIQKMTKTSEKNLAEERRNIFYMMEKHRNFMEAAGQYGFSRSWIEAKQDFLEGRRTAFVLSMAVLFLTNPVLTVRRLRAALPNFTLNRRFSRFHKE